MNMNKVLWKASTDNIVGWEIDDGQFQPIDHKMFIFDGWNEVERFMQNKRAWVDTIQEFSTTDTHPYPRIVLTMVILCTSEDWNKSYPEYVVIDPDGWDRKNYEFSWHKELILYSEFQRRLAHSTIMIDKRSIV